MDIQRQVYNHVLATCATGYDTRERAYRSDIVVYGQTHTAYELDYMASKRKLAMQVSTNHIVQQKARNNERI